MTQEKLSSLQRYLAGRTLPNAPTAAPVKVIEKKGADRVVTFDDGTSKTYTKRQLVGLFNSRLQGDQSKMALKSIRETPEGRVRVTIGGREQGERREYASKGAAVRAVNRAYPKAFNAK